MVNFLCLWSFILKLWKASRTTILAAFFSGPACMSFNSRFSFCALSKCPRILSVILGLAFDVVVPRTSRAVEDRVCEMKSYSSSIGKFSQSVFVHSFARRAVLRRSLYFCYDSKAVRNLGRVFDNVMFSVMLSYVISGL